MIRKTMKWTLIAGTAVLVGGSLLGKDRVHNLFSTVHEQFVANVDELINEEVRLKREIEKLQDEYPQQLAELRAQLNEVNAAVREIESEVALGRQVMDLAAADLEALEPEVAAVAVRSEPGAKVLHQRVARIRQTRDSYASRVERGVQELDVLHSERRRIANELSSLEAEAAEFQAQLAQLEREVESIKRGEELLEIARKRRASEENRLTNRATNALDRLQGALSQRRAEQAEQLQQLQVEELHLEYENRARFELEGESEAANSGLYY